MLLYMCMCYCVSFCCLVIDDPCSTPTESSKKNMKRKLRRERRKLMKKKLKSPESSDGLMSKLPFALTSPTSWKELGCTYILNTLNTKTVNSK